MEETTPPQPQTTPRKRSLVSDPQSDRKPFLSGLSLQSAILIGSVLISLAILLSGGVIRIKGLSSTKQAATTTTTTPTTQTATGQPPDITADLATVKDTFQKAQIKFGDTNKKLVVIEVADPSCPFCHAAAGRNPELNKQMGSQFVLVADGGSYVAPMEEIEKLVKAGSASFAYIYTPGHGNGEMGTKALYCANEKGKFWDVHDMLMTAEGYDLLNNQIKNDKTKSQQLADFLKPVFDPTAMKQCVDSGKYDSRLQQDVTLAGTLGISGTPGFYINDTKYAGAYNYTQMEPTVKQALGI